MRQHSSTIDDTRRHTQLQSRTITVILTLRARWCAFLAAKQEREGGSRPESQGYAIGYKTVAPSETWGSYTSNDAPNAYDAPSLLVAAAARYKPQAELPAAPGGEGGGRPEPYSFTAGHQQAQRHHRRHGGLVHRAGLHEGHFQACQSQVCCLGNHETDSPCYR